MPLAEEIFVVGINWVVSIWPCIYLGMLSSVFCISCNAMQQERVSVTPIEFNQFNFENTY